MPTGFVRLVNSKGEIVGKPVELIRGIARFFDQRGELGEFECIAEYDATRGGDFRMKPARLRIVVERPRRPVTGGPDDLLGTWVVTEGNAPVAVGEVSFRANEEYEESVPNAGRRPDFYLLKGTMLELGLSPQNSPTGGPLRVQWGRIRWLDPPFHTRFDYQVREVESGVGDPSRVNQTYVFQWKAPEAAR
jgi:hypothetical protein